MAEKTDYEVMGLEFIARDVPKDSAGKDCEALRYRTPSGSELVIAKDFMGIQICKAGRFFPPPFASYDSIEDAVSYLRENTKEAISFFDEVSRQEQLRKIASN